MSPKQTKVASRPSAELKVTINAVFSVAEFENILHNQLKLWKAERIFSEFQNRPKFQLTVKNPRIFPPKPWLHVIAVTDWFYFEFFCFYSHTSKAAFIPYVISSDVQDLKSMSAKKPTRLSIFHNLMCTNSHSTKDLSVAPLSSTVISLTFCVQF